MTNYEKIMSEMTVEKMTEHFRKVNFYRCTRCPVDNCKNTKVCCTNFKEWLNKEAKK